VTKVSKVINQLKSYLRSQAMYLRDPGCGTYPRISVCRCDRNEIPTATLVFSGSSNSVRILLQGKATDPTCRHQSKINQQNFRIQGSLLMKTPYINSKRQKALDYGGNLIRWVRFGNRSSSFLRWVAEKQKNSNFTTFTTPIDRFHNLTF
jgi:hypothetical protein